jgi:hypothetical protein
VIVNGWTNIPQRNGACGRNRNLTNAMLGCRSSSTGEVLQALTFALHQIADRKEVMVAQKAHLLSLATTS